MKTTSNEHEQHCYQSAVVKEAMALDPETVYAQGYAAWQEGRYDRALIDFGWLVMSQPWSWRAHVALAGALMMTKRVCNGDELLWLCADA